MMNENVKIAKELIRIAKEISSAEHGNQTYSEDFMKDAETILSDIIFEGKSSGWSGSEEDFERLEKFLKRFNVVYTDDFNGTWELKL